MFVADCLAVRGLTLVGFWRIYAAPEIPIPLLSCGAIDRITKRLKKNRAIVLVTVVARVVDFADVADITVRCFA